MAANGFQRVGGWNLPSRACEKGKECGVVIRHILYNVELVAAIE